MMRHILLSKNERCHYSYSIMRKLIAVVLLLFAIQSACAAGPASWFEVETPHFTILTDSNEKQARHLAGQFERMRAVFHMLLPNAADDSGSRIIVLAVRNRNDFQALEPEAYLGKGKLDLAGLFMHSDTRNYILLRLDAQGDHPFATVYHEYTHFTTRKAEWLPIWLNEGLAEFYENTDIRDKDVLLGQPNPNDILYLRQTRLIPLATLFAVDYNSPYYHEEDKGTIFYAESWALTHYLEINDYKAKTHRIEDYAHYLLQHEDSVTAAQHAFGDLNALQRELQSYTQQALYQAFQIKTPITFDETTLQVRLIPTAEADAYRADVLVDNGRTHDAEALLDTALQAAPSVALIHEVMGNLKLRQKDLPAAEKYFGEAVALNSQSYTAHYFYAMSALQSGDREHDAAVESSLRSAIALNPSFAPAYDTLAMFYGFRHKNLDEAHRLNAQAVQLDPENLAYRINTANVLMEEQQFPSAVGVLRAAMPVAKTSEDRAMLQTRIDGIERYQASIEAARQANRQSAAASSTVVVSQQSSSQATPSSPPQIAGKQVVFQKVDGKLVGTAETIHYPAGDATGPQHTIKGIIRSVRCSSPSVLAFSLDQSGKQVALYNNDFYKITFTTANFEPGGDIKPCTDIEGMKATVRYAEVTDPTVAGQILAIELSK